MECGWKKPRKWWMMTNPFLLLYTYTKNEEWSVNSNNTKTLFSLFLRRRKEKKYKKLTTMCHRVGVNLYWVNRDSLFYFLRDKGHLVSSSLLAMKEIWGRLFENQICVREFFLYEFSLQFFTSQGKALNACNKKGRI